MPSSDGTASGSSQNLKPKASKANLKSVPAEPSPSGRLSKSEGSVSKKNRAPGESALIKSPDTSGNTAAGKNKTVEPPAGSIKSPKVSGKSPAASSSSASSAILKVKKKKSSSTAGQALNPKKSSLRKLPPAEEKPIEPTDDLEPIGESAEQGNEEDEQDETTVAYKEPPADGDDAEAGNEGDDPDAVTETYVLNTEDEKAGEKSQAKKQDDDDEDSQDDSDAEEVKENGATEAEAEKDAQEEGDSEETDATAGKSGKKKAKSEQKSKVSGKDSKAEPGKIPGRRARSSRKGAAEAGSETDAAAEERGSKRTAAQKKSNRAQALLFLFFLIGTILGLIGIAIVWYVKWGMPQPKDELRLYEIPVYEGESFQSLQSEFDESVNTLDLLAAQNPEVPKDKGFDKALKIKIAIPPKWKFVPQRDTDFIQHWLAVVETAIEKDPPDIPAANRELPILKKMLARFVLKVPESTEDTKKKWQTDVDQLVDKIALAEGNANAPPKPPETGPGSIEDQDKKLRRLGTLCNPVNNSVFQAYSQMKQGDKAEALVTLKSALDQIAKLHELQAPDSLEKQVVATIEKEQKLKPLFDKGEALTLDDFETTFPDINPLGNLCKQIDGNLLQAGKLLAEGKKPEALQALAAGLDQIEQLKAEAGPDQGEPKVAATLAKGEKIKALHDKGDGLTLEDVQTAFPEIKP